MSKIEDEKDMRAFNCFNSFKFENDKKRKETFHEIIEEDNDFLINFFNKQPYYREVMPIIQKNSRGNYFYNKMVKKGIKHKSPFFKAIIKAIKELEEEKNKINVFNLKKKINRYNMSQIELLKIKKKQIEKLSKKKIKDIRIKNEKFNKYTNLIKTNSLSSSTINFNTIIKKPKLISPLNTYNLNHTNNSFNKKDNLNEKIFKNLNFSPLNKNLSSFFRSDNNFKNISRNKSYSNTLLCFPRFNNSNVNYIYEKCSEEIENGNKVSGNFFKLNKIISKSVEKKLKNYKIINNDKKIIEDKNEKRNKYLKLEENNYAKIKRKMNEKISYYYAYNNRKEFHEILKGNENLNGYILYLDEIRKTNEKMERQRKVERKKIEKIETLCDDGFKKKEFLKNKIDKFNKIHKDSNKDLNIISYDEFYVTKKKSNNKLMGNLLPKLLSLKEKYFDKIHFGDSLNNKK